MWDNSRHLHSVSRSRWITFRYREYFHSTVRRGSHHWRISGPHLGPTWHCHYPGPDRYWFRRQRHPGSLKLEYPVLLDQPMPALSAYPREIVAAEKFEAMVSLDLANRRMKDFYDLFAISCLFSFDGATLASAISATFKRRSPFGELSFVHCAAIGYNARRIAAGCLSLSPHIYFHPAPGLRPGQPRTI